MLLGIVSGCVEKEERYADQSILRSYRHRSRDSRLWTDRVTEPERSINTLTASKYRRQLRRHRDARGA